MSTPANQIEFAQIFERLAREFDMTKAEVARALSIERSYMSMILKYQRIPSTRVLEALRAVEVRLRGGGDQNGSAGLDRELRGMMERLRKLRESDPKSFLAVKTLVEGLAGRD